MAAAPWGGPEAQHGAGSACVCVASHLTLCRAAASSGAALLLRSCRVTSLCYGRMTSVQAETSPRKNRADDHGTNGTQSVICLQLSASQVSEQAKALRRMSRRRQWFLRIPTSERRLHPANIQDGFATPFNRMECNPPRTGNCVL